MNMDMSGYEVRQHRGRYWTLKSGSYTVRNQQASMSRWKASANSQLECKAHETDSFDCAHSVKPRLAKVKVKVEILTSLDPVRSFVLMRFL